MRDEYRTANGAAEVVFLILGHGGLEEVPRIEVVVPNEFKDVSVEILGTRFRHRFDSPGSVSAVLRAVVGGQHPHLGDGIHIGVDVERAVAAVIHVIAAIHLPVVVLDAAAINAHGNAAGDADGTLILSGLIAYAGDQRDQLREIAAVEHQLADLFPGDDARQFRGLGLNLRHACSLHADFTGDLPNFEGGVHPRFFAQAQHHANGFERLEASGRDLEVVGGRRQGRHQKVAICVSVGLQCDARADIDNSYFGAGKHCPRGIPNRPGNRTSILSVKGSGCRQTCR